MPDIWGDITEDEAEIAVGKIMILDPELARGGVGPRSMYADYQVAPPRGDRPPPHKVDNPKWLKVLGALQLRATTYTIFMLAQAYKRAWQHDR